MNSDSWIPQFIYLQFPNVEKWNPRTSSDNPSSCKLNFFCVANNETIICSPGPGCQSNASVRTRAKPSTGHCSTAVQGDHSPTHKMQSCSENVSPLQCQRSLVPELLHSVVQCLKYCDLWTHWTLSSFNAITAAAIKCEFYVWVKNSSSILFKIFVFAWHQGSGNTGNTAQCCSGAAGGEMELQCCSARSALPAPRRTRQYTVR